jgi:DNA-directed RNA polymerase alpha subunit
MITEKQYLESVGIINQYLLEQVSFKHVKKINIIDTDISVRLYSSLRNHRIYFLNELSDMTFKEVMNIKQLGKKSLEELEEVMEYHKIPISWKRERVMTEH